MTAGLKTRFTFAARWAFAIVGGAAAYVSSVLVIQSMIPKLTGHPAPSWTLAAVALPPLLLGYWISPLSRRTKRSKHRVEIRLDPELYDKMRVRMRSRGYARMAPYITSLIRDDTKGLR